MPNIIEQQDLLKGLPDNRIAMLLQNPVGDIPPFLVAAEAQRRQSIRQQFAGGPQESVVDTLTKQISGVPQNIQTPAQTPPMVPQTPPMQGVMALQQQQAMQQAAQQVMPQQQMRHGGMVQRYQAGSLVQPSFRGRSGSGGYLPGEEPEGGFLSDILGDIGQYGGEFMENVKQFGINMTPEQREALRAESERKAAGDFAIPSEEMKPPPNAKIPRRTTPTPTENPTPPPVPQRQPGETEDQFKARIAELYNYAGPSDWEKAQRWFAMSQQFLDPSKTTMQSIASAGQVFSEAAAEDARAQREAKFMLEKAMLDRDMAIAESRSSAAAEAAKDAREFSQRMQERGTPTADAAISAILRSISEAEKEASDLTKDLLPGQPLPPEIQTRIDAIQKRKSDLSRQLVIIMDRGGFANRQVVSQEELDNLGPL